MADYNRLQASSLAAEKDISVISSGSNGRLDLARAAVSEAEDAVASEKATLEAAEARLAQAQANFTRAEADRQRYAKLLAKHEISQSEYDRVATEADTDKSAVVAGKAEIAAAKQRVSRGTEQVDPAQSGCAGGGLGATADCIFEGQSCGGRHPMLSAPGRSSPRQT